MTTLRVNLHPAQRVIFNSPARFKVVAAGRRFGKTVLAVILCLLAGLSDESWSGVPLSADSEVVYFGVDREQAKRNAWNHFKELGRPVIAKVHEKDYVITLVNGVRIRLMGMDNPDSARGMKLRFAVLDEYADMPDWVWQAIVRPALSDTGGGGLFIGTPKGKNHFYTLFMNALNNPGVDLDGEVVYPYKDYEAFTFAQSDNPFIREEELKALRAEYSGASKQVLQEELEAKFIAKGGALFNSDQFPTDPQEPKDGSYFVTLDPSGFLPDPKNRGQITRRDEAAIAVVKAHQNGWWVKEIITGQWDPRETSFRLVKAALDNQAVRVGIEKGSLMNAMLPYLSDYQRQYNRWLSIQPVTHGNQRKWDRIQWALQGRAEKGQIVLNPGPWVEKFIDQAVDFPDQRSRDDMLDALAYIDQIAKVMPSFDWSAMPDDYEPLDTLSGY